MEKIKQIRGKVEKIILEEDKYNFPRILLELRKCFGISRFEVCRETEIQPTRLATFENGTFYGKPRKHEINTLSEYYGINEVLLDTKAMKFVANRSGHQSDLE